MVNLEKLKEIHREISQSHQDLIKILDSVDLEMMSVIPTKEQSNKVCIDICLFEEITNLTSKLYDKDLQIDALLKPYTLQSSTSQDLKSLRRNLTAMKRTVLENTKIMKKDLKKISLILNEYKERCRSGFLDFLSCLEIDLRRTLKPLVPSDVLVEQLNFRPICTDPDLLLSQSLTRKEEAGQMPGETTEDKLNIHMQLLVNTLEDVAKSLIAITQNTYRSYYELVDPRLLYSEPPSPLAAPLPEYFSYDVGNNSEENRRKTELPLSGNAKQRILQKFVVLQKINGTKTPITSRKTKEKLEEVLAMDVKGADLLQFFKEEGIPVSEREKLVYDIINSERSGGKDVSLDDIIWSNGDKPKYSPVPQLKTPAKEALQKNIYQTTENDSDLEIKTLETFVNLKEKLPRTRSKNNLMENKYGEIPVLNFHNRHDIRIDENKDMKGYKQGKASTPGKVRKSKPEKKRIKRTRTPVLQKKAKINK